ncbi:mechanosensitive ion channel family protein [Dyadobacter tibetensis]|uniref:mechanosensitive ion channel family protein n=1 Tax=Dyadobacter tibetensis TaxID=1211851 RepID=UPI00046F1F5B|nr:mechanosensitive ion channel family protein [Dyadobacter tibetensis]
MLLFEFSNVIDPVKLKLDRWGVEGAKLIPNLILAVLLLIVFRYLAGYSSKFLKRILNRISNNEALVGLLAALAKIAVFTVGLFFALGVMGLEKTVASLVAGAGVLALAIGFAFQDLTANFISGAFIAIQRPIRVGDVIETNGFTGKVLSINLRSVILDNFAGQFVELPSKDIFQKPIVNYSNSGERRVQLLCGVAYDSDLERVERLALETINSLEFLSVLRPVELQFTQFGDSSIDFQLLFWIDPSKTGPGPAKSIAIKALKLAFEKEGITIPFPVRTLEYVPKKEDKGV